ncbi:hypothetical protein CHH65_13740 [Shouchella clausii]|uniref:hypothetical protein n=1 Tax=Shouchella clausii TaxID=79880 RepID=UPI000BA70C7C|nr:hypothetical protein [Shouchella clausii]PAF08645.1 hypothetical protein CHH65_13740 [Shouchella clausii]
MSENHWAKKINYPEYTKPSESHLMSEGVNISSLIQDKMNDLNKEINEKLEGLLNRMIEYFGIGLNEAKERVRNEYNTSTNEQKFYVDDQLALTIKRVYDFDKNKFTVTFKEHYE